MAEWILAGAALVGIFVSIYSGVRSLGRNEAQFKARIQMVEARIDGVAKTCEDIAQICDEHIKVCAERAVGEGKTEGKVEQRLATLENGFAGSRTTLHWIGDCIMVLGAKMNVQLPDRPQ